MRLRAVWLFWWFGSIATAFAQVPQVKPLVLSKPDIEGNVTAVEVAAHFVTAIRMPDTVNSVVVGDPALFQVEHSDREPQLVFVKVLTTKPALSNLLVSTTHGREVSLLLVSRGSEGAEGSVDFLLKYKAAGHFLIEPDYPSSLVAQTLSVSSAEPDNRTVSPGTNAAALAAQSVNLASPVDGDPPVSTRPDTAGEMRRGGMDELLARQERAPLPVLYGEHVAVDTASGDHVRAGISEVIDGGQQVVVLFSAVNPTEHSILLMPPQVQLGGKIRSGKILKRSRWTSAEQLPVMDYRLSRRRLGSGERADGVVVFERPPYKQSNETLLLQVAESGAVDRPALAPIGFGISTFGEKQHGNSGK
jgi:hypothetical protein